jgi:hypothetical protein
VRVTTLPYTTNRQNILDIQEITEQQARDTSRRAPEDTATFTPEANVPVGSHDSLGNDWMAPPVPNFSEVPSPHHLAHDLIWHAQVPHFSEVPWEIKSEGSPDAVIDCDCDSD